MKSDEQQSDTNNATVTSNWAYIPPLTPLSKMRSRLAAEGYKKIAVDDGCDDEDDENTEYSAVSLSKNHQGNHRTNVDDGTCRIKQPYLVICIALAVVVITFLASTLIWQRLQLSSQPCKTPGCVITSSYLLSKMNQSADPCQDFYTYACGGWLKNTMMPPDKAKWNAFADMYRQNQAILKKLLDKDGEIVRGHASKAVKKTKDFYKLCMDEEKIEEKGPDPVLKLIKELGSWSVSDNPISGVWNATSWDMFEALVKIHWYSSSALFSMGMTVDNENSSSYIIVFGQSGLTLDTYKEYLRDDTPQYETGFIEYATGFAELLGATNNTKSLIQDIYNFEHEMAKIYTPDEELIDPVKSYHKMTIAQFQEIFVNFPVKAYLDKMFKLDISEMEEILVPMPNYFKKLSELLKNTSSETLANYFVWNVISELPGYLPNAFKDAAMKLEQAERGVSVMGPLWSRCIGKVDRLFGYVTGELYVEEKFPESSKEQISDYLDRIRDAFIANLPSVQWMDEVTRLRAVDKAKAISKLVGYPDWAKNTTLLDEYYDTLAIPDDFFQAHLNRRLFSTQKNFNYRGTTPRKDKWYQSPTTVNAYYSPSNNQMAFPAGILQRPFYDPAFPQAVNFASIVFIMGHELTHGFDNSGRKYDKYGNLNSWWTEESSSGFQKHSQCFVDQYGNYSFGGEHINGLMTLGENIADNGGLMLSYRAYEEWLKNNDASKQLAGLDLTDKQQFFLGFAQVWCVFSTPAYAKQSVLVDVHSPGKYRVEGVLSNMPEFSEAFQCPKGSTLNPEHKCHVW